MLGERFDIAARHELADRITAALDAATSSLHSAERESPILAFEKWLTRYVTDCGKLSQTEYSIAYAAFIAAHPGEGPLARTMNDLAPAERTRVEGEQSYSEGFDDAARVARVLSNVATSGSARRAAEEWFTLERQQMYKIFNIDHPAQIPPYLQRQREKYVAELAAIISKYFATAPADNDAESLLLELTAVFVTNAIRVHTLSDHGCKWHDCLADVCHNNKELIQRARGEQPTPTKGGR